MTVLAAASGIALAGRRVHARLLLSRAKHPSVSGHAKMSKRLARLLPYYGFDDDRFFVADDAPSDVAGRRKAGFERLAQALRARAPRTLALGEAMTPGVSDMQFTGLYRVPFQFSRYVQRHLRVGSFLDASGDVWVTDADGNTAYDLAGSYGLNVFGYDFYKACIDAGADRVRDLGPVLGSYHPLVADNVERLLAISGLDEVSFHMSGTEAVMQAVRLARYHTGRTQIAVFCGAYHGWWDGVQPGVGNPRPTHDVYTLKEMDGTTLRVLHQRDDIACVLVNPIQALHPNHSAPGDAALIGPTTAPVVDRDEYRAWLRQLREVCTAKGIVLIFDEVFVGFRLAYGGAQEYFGVRADMVTYGKSVGGGLPVGVLCGQRDLMRRYRDDRPADVCFARGTFNAHPYVMGAMNEFLRRIDTPHVRETYAASDALWAGRAASLNGELAALDLPVRVAHLTSIWSVRYTAPSRYNWMFQYYLREEGLALSWVGSGRLIFSHSYTDADFAAVQERFVAAARAMREDGWWWHPAGASAKTIKRRVLMEMLAVKAPWLASTGVIKAAAPVGAYPRTG
jgi:glutamate-1-semialdehyde 2,1-aminomutase